MHCRNYESSIRYGSESKPAVIQMPQITTRSLHKLAELIANELDDRGFWDEDEAPGRRSSSSRGGRRRQIRYTPKKRKASKSQLKYGRAFKRLCPKYKKKNGQWKKDGFKRCVKAAHRACK